MATTGQGQTAHVPQWGRFEASLAGSASGNPYLDVELSATFTQGQRSIEALGFYDGDGTYRVRFMPDTEGTWTYAPHSNSPDLDGRTGSFVATAPSARFGSR